MDVSIENRRMIWKILQCFFSPISRVLMRGVIWILVCWWMVKVIHRPKIVKMCLRNIWLVPKVSYPTFEGGFFRPWSLLILKSSHENLSNEGSNIILSLPEVSHWVVETQPFFFEKLPVITDSGFIQQSQNRARF